MGQRRTVVARRRSGRLLLATVTASAVVLAGAGVTAWSTATAAPGGDTATPVPTLTVPAAPRVLTSPAPAAKAAKPSKPAAKQGKLTLAQLRAEVARVDADLDRRTAELDHGKAALDESKMRLVVVQRAAVQARIDADRAHDDLGRYAAAAYRGNQLPTDLTVLMSPAGGATDTLRNLQSLEQTGVVKADIATYAAATARRADSLQQQAATLYAASTRMASQLATKRDEVSALAVQADKQLNAEVARLAAVAAKRLAAGCLAKTALAQEFPNGLIPVEVLCAIDKTHYLRGDAAVTFRAMNAAYAKQFKAPLCIESAYRTRELQTKLFAADPVMVAAPGHSYHGLGVALDLCGGVQLFGSPQHKWLDAHAADYGWYHPTWAEPDGVTPEPWHWEYGTPR